MGRSWSAVVAAAVVVLSGVIGVAPAAARQPGDAPPGDAPQSGDAPPVEVVGGSAVAPGRFPWVVRLSMGCGGSLIAPRYVLTAAHCVPRSGRTRSIVVIAGSPDLGSGRVIRVRSTAVRRASGFRSATRGDDWAVVRLERALALPTVRLARGPWGDRGRFTVLGWGSTREGGGVQRRLRAARVPFVGDDRCARAYRVVGYRFVRAEMLCAGDFRRGGVDACQGDSGGPLVRRDRRGWVQVGIVSWGHGCGRPGFPGIYTQVSAFAEGIRAAVRDRRAAPEAGAPVAAARPTW